MSNISHGILPFTKSHNKDTFFGIKNNRYNMSNEIDFEEFIRNIDCAIYEKIDVDNWNISIEVVLDVVEFLQQSLEDLRTYIVNHPFSSKEEEIYFLQTHQTGSIE